MTITLTNRSVIRTALYTLINTNVVGSGKGLSLLYKYQPTAKELSGKSPAGWLSSGPTKREAVTYGERTLSSSTYLLQTAVKLSGGLSASAVEDRLDLIELEIRQLFADPTNRATANWDDLRLEEESVPGYSTIGGEEYRIELFAITIDWRDN